VHVQHRRSLPGSPRCAHRKHPTRGPTASAAARKGRKARLCSLWPATARLLRDSSTKRGAVRDGAGSLLVFANASGEPLTRYGARYLLRRNAQRAARLAPSLKTKKLHPHSIPDSTAVALLNSGVALATISQWLGHAGLRAFD
jgi:site-specific recombinase XerD